MYLFLCAALVAADYGLKALAVAKLEPIGSLDIIPNILSLRFHINYGAAFGIFQNRTVMLVIFNVLVIAVLLYLIISNKFGSRLFRFSAALITAGGIGNLLDRLLREGGGVVDYIYFEPINFPIFNFADCCVTAGTILLLAYVLFIENQKQPKAEKTEDAQ